MIKTKPAHVAKPPKQTTTLGGCPRASGLSVHSGQGEDCMAAACDLLSLALWGRAQLPLPGHVAVPLLVTYPPCSRVGAHRHPQMGRSKAEPGKGTGQQKREDVGLRSKPREAAHLPVRPPGTRVHFVPTSSLARQSISTCCLFPLCQRCVPGLPMASNHEGALAPGSRPGLGFGSQTLIQDEGPGARAGMMEAGGEGQSWHP